MDRIGEVDGVEVDGPSLVSLPSNDVSHDSEVCVDAFLVAVVGYPDKSRGTSLSPRSSFVVAGGSAGPSITASASPLDIEGASHTQRVTDKQEEMFSAESPQL